MSFFKTASFVVLLFLGLVSNAQILNSYQYVIVPEKFEFQREAHDYDLNKMVQFKLNKVNFVAIIEGSESPNNFSICDALKASVEDKGFLHTKLVLTLKNCKGDIVYTSPKGLSIKKDYKIAYYEAIRKVFKDPLLKSHKYLAVKKTETSVPKKPLPEVLTKPRPVTPIVGAPKALTGKRVTKTPAKATGISLLFELRGKQYTFKPVGDNYVISQSGKTIGQATFNSADNNYDLSAGALSGKGVFDDYGNFELSRLNPVTQKPIKDILARVE